MLLVVFKIPDFPLTPALQNFNGVCCLILASLILAICMKLDRSKRLSMAFVAGLEIRKHILLSQKHLFKCTEVLGLT